jgi:hypothetical protein
MWNSIIKKPVSPSDANPVALAQPNVPDSAEFARARVRTRPENTLTPWGTAMLPAEAHHASKLEPAPGQSLRS